MATTSWASVAADDALCTRGRRDSREDLRESTLLQEKGKDQMQNSTIILYKEEVYHSDSDSASRVFLGAGNYQDSRCSYVLSQLEITVFPWPFTNRIAEMTYKANAFLLGHKVM